LLNRKIKKFFFLYNFKVLLKSYNFCLRNLFLLYFRRYSPRKKNIVFFQRSVSCYIWISARKKNVSFRFLNFITYFMENHRTMQRGRSPYACIALGLPMLRNPEIWNTKHNARGIAIAIEIRISSKIK